MIDTFISSIHSKLRVNKNLKLVETDDYHFPSSLPVGVETKEFSSDTFVSKIESILNYYYPEKEILNLVIQPMNQNDLEDALKGTWEFPWVYLVIHFSTR